MSDEPIKIAGIPLGAPSVEEARFTGLVWGPIGAGKTPLGITMPAPILFVLFDVDGQKSVLHQRDRYDLFDLTRVSDLAIDQFALPDSQLIQDLDKVLATGKYRSLLFDSLTAYLDRAIARAVIIAANKVKTGDRPDIFAPQLSGYGARATLLRRTVLNIHNLCAKHNINLLFTSHEKEKLDKQGATIEINPMLAGESQVQIPKNISEIWLLRDVNAERRIYLRQWNLYTPMRTRMFTIANPSQPYFVWDFNADTWKGSGTIENWLERWRKSGGGKINPVEK